MIALVLLPALAALLLAGSRVNAALDVAAGFQRVNEAAKVVSLLGELADDLQNERDQTARYVSHRDRVPDRSAVNAAYNAVDATKNRVLAGLDKVNADYGTRAVEKARKIRVRLERLPALRLGGAADLRLPGTIVGQYHDWIADVLALHDEVRQGAGDAELTSGVLALSSLAQAKEQLSVQRGLLSAAFETGRVSPSDLETAEAARARQDGEIDSFRTEAAAVYRQLYDDTVTGSLVDRAEFLRLQAVSSADDTGRIRVSGSDPQDWFAASTATLERVRKVESALSEAIILRSASLQQAERSTAYLAVGVLLALLLAVLLFTFLVARSLIAPLRRLRREALEIAGIRLPDTVRRLRESGDPAARVDPIVVISHDEIGEVARAFDEVHREAVRLAEEEARLRANVNAMFVNLSRRSQTLVERQITLIDSLEQGEQDEQRLGNLFRLDHLATRMRRNSENLLVLAGQDPPRRWSQPVRLVDVARASLSEVENYERVAIQVPDGSAVAGQAVNDVIHLLAELVENALSFSPGETRVIISGNHTEGGGIMLSVTDHGIGMTGEELLHANERLENSPTVDVSVSRRMGLFVVARLAHRHGVRVQLRQHGSGGLTAMVLLPETLLGGHAGPQGAARARPEFTSPSPALAAPSIAPAPSDQWPMSLQPYAAKPSPDEPSQLDGASRADDHPLEGPPAPGGPGQDGPADPGLTWPASMDSGPVDPAAAPGGLDSADPWLAERGWNSSPPAEEPRTPGRPSPLDRTPLDFPETEPATGPIPAVRQPSAGDEFLPIFASVESAWFEQSGGSWGSGRADAGWNAAEAVREPVNDGATSAGLPKRVPRANLVPGSADTAVRAAAAPPPPAPAPPPDRVRSRLSSFQQGFRAARADLSEGRVPGADGRADGGETEHGAGPDRLGPGAAEPNGSERSGEEDA